MPLCGRKRLIIYNEMHKSLEGTMRGLVDRVKAAGNVSGGKQRVTVNTKQDMLNNMVDEQATAELLQLADQISAHFASDQVVHATTVEYISHPFMLCVLIVPKSKFYIVSRLY